MDIMMLGMEREKSKLTPRFPARVILKEMGKENSFQKEQMSKFWTCIL